MKRLLTFLVLGGLALAALPVGSAHAQSQPPTFAGYSFSQKAGGPTISFTNSSPPATLTASATSVPISFTFFESPFLGSAVLADETVKAKLTWTKPSATTDTAILDGTNVLQRFPTSSAGEIEIRAAQAYVFGSVNIAANQLLLKIAFTGGALTGHTNDRSGNYQVSAATETVDFSTSSSQLFNFSLISGAQNMALGFTGISGLGILANNGLTINGGNLLVNSFTTTGGSGSFSAAFVPEPSTLAMVGLGLIGVPALAVVRRRRAAR